MSTRRIIVSVLVVATLAVIGWNLRRSGLFTHPLEAAGYIGSGRFVNMPATGTPFERQVLSTYTFKGETGHYIDDRVYALGAYDRPELELLVDLLRARKPSGGVFVDVGANIGHHALYVAGHAERVVAVEPWPPVLERLEAMVAANQITNVDVHRVGYSDQPGSLPFYAPPESNPGMGSFDPEWGANHLEGELPLVRGDDDLGPDAVVDVMKVDIEGFERLALEGLRQTLWRERPAVLFELNARPGGFNNEDQIRATFPPDYAFFDVHEGENYAIETPFGAWVYGPLASGVYELTPFSGNFEQHMVLAMDPATAGKFASNGATGAVDAR